MKTIHNSFLFIAIYLAINFDCRCQTVLASSFGYNPLDATQALMNAINSENDTIIVDLQTDNWKVGSMHFWNLTNKTIIFEPGVVVEALPGGFMGYYQRLFRFHNCDRLNLIGYGATLKMNKAEYAAIDDSEYRHSIMLNNCRNVTIKGLTVIESGGDGLSIDGNQLDFCENILVEDCRFLNHYRQGLSIMNVQNMTVRHCEFSGTAGTLPEAGIDIEPYQTEQRIVNLLIEHCYFENNGWSGVAVNLIDLDATSLDVSITVRDCVFKNNCRPENTYAKCEIYASDNHLSPVQGDVLFERCFVLESNYCAFYTTKTAGSYKLTLKDCVFQNVSKLQELYNEPISIEVRDYFNPSPPIGGIHFDNLLLHYTTDFAFFRIFSSSTLQGVEDLTGNITIVEPKNNPPILSGFNVSFATTNQTSLPPTTIASKVKDMQAIECTQLPAEIIFSRTSNDVSYPLGISYDINGSATNADDFHFQPLGIVIPSHKNIASLPILAREDGEAEDEEFVIIDILSSPLYILSDSVMTEISVIDCEVLSIEENHLNDIKLVAFPNPTPGKVTVILEPNQVVDFEGLYDLFGRYRNVSHNDYGANTIEIDLSNLNSGIYILKVNNKAIKIVKE